MPWPASSCIRSATGGDPVDRAVKRGCVDAAAGVLAEGGEARDAQPRRALLRGAARSQLRRLDPAAAEVAEDVAAVQRRDGAVADHHAARDRAVAVGGLAGRVAAAALEGAPAEVPAAAGAHEVDLLDLVLADVADRQVAVAAVEREPPRVAQPVGVDLVARAGPPDEGVRARYAVGARSGRARVDPQDLAEQRAEVLRVAARAVAVTAAAAVAR